MHGCQNFCSLSDVVVVAMLISIQLQEKNKSMQCQIHHPNVIDFDFELLILCSHMAFLVVKIFAPFLELCKKKLQ